MTNFNIIEVQNIDSSTTTHIVVENDNGSRTTFPAVEDNPHYQAWLAAGNTLPT